MQAVTLAGRAIEIAEQGPPDGPALVLAGALGTDLRVWDALPAHLPPGLRIVRVAMAGHGASDTAGVRRMADHAGDVLAVLDDRGIDRATMVGLSVGGMVALALAERAPERVASLVLCCTAHRIGTAALWSQRIADVEGKGLPAMADAILERWFSAEWRAAEPGLLALWRNVLARTSPDGYTAVCAAIRDADLTEAARRWAGPALCIAGERDGSTPPEVVRGLADLMPAARFAQIDGVGHIPPVEAPERLGRLITDFLEEHGLG
jgi:3-oxoadipate enol-lactonase